MQKNNEILLYFGSFNPVHNGHLAIASYFTEFYGTRELWFVVTPQNPLKNAGSLLADRDRQHLVNLAIGDYPRFKVSDIEFYLPKPNYTINTLTYLSEKFPTKKFSLLIGADNLQTFHKWKNYQRIIENYRIYVYKRPGAEIPALSKYVGADIVVPDVPQIEISSSMIRNAIKENKDVRFYLPAKAYDYIKEMGWYR